VSFRLVFLYTLNHQNCTHRFRVSKVLFFSHVFRRLFALIRASRRETTWCCRLCESGSQKKENTVVLIWRPVHISCNMFRFDFVSPLFNIRHLFIHSYSGIYPFPSHSTHHSYRLLAFINRFFFLLSPDTKQEERLPSCWTRTLILTKQRNSKMEVAAPCPPGLGETTILPLMLHPHKI
jgi:hypothetical protein